MEPSQTKRMAIKEEDDGTNNGGCSIQYPQIEEEDDDRLSTLPDSVLITIISLLPIKVAAATSVLSRRWRNLWTHTTHLSIHLNFNDLQCFFTNVNHIISQLQSPKIHTFHFQLPIPLSWYTIEGTHEVSPGLLVPWIHQICLRNPEVIKLYFIADLFQIPYCLFETQSLVELVLHGNPEFNFLHGQMLSVKFPNLKKLTITLYDRHCALVGRNGTLFRGCPLLEDLELTLQFDEDDHIVDISTPNLKTLIIDAAARKLEDCKFVIDAPKLEKCDIRGYLAFYEFVSNPSNLQKVKVDNEDTSFEGDNNYTSKIRTLIHGISCVRSLELNFEVHLLNSIIDLNTRPIFQNLTHLTFSYDIHDWLDKLPGCFSLGNLKIVDIQGLGYGDVEINLVQHILSNANVLEQLHISTANYVNSNDHLRKEYEFCKKLFMLPKSSVNCQIEFYGSAITASSKDFRDGVLSCQIRNHPFWPDTV